MTQDHSLHEHDAKPNGSSANSSQSELEKAAPQIAANGNKRTTSKLRWLILGALAVLIVLGLALGLGLGLGLRNRSSSSNLSALSNGQNLPVVPRDKLVDPASFTLDPSWDRNAPPQVRAYNWTVSRILASPAGVQKPMVVVNGMSPGPTIEANLGDTILVNVKNELGNVTTSVHWHGQFQNGTNFQDGTVGVTECGIAPGDTRIYNWTVQNTGTYWWHAHAGGQYSDGLLGSLVLHSPNETFTLANSTSTTTTTNTTYDGDIIVPVSDIWHSISAQWLATYFQPGNANGAFDGAEPVPDSGLVAGYGTGTCDGLPAGTPCDGGQYFNYTLEPNKRYRLRIINVGSLATINFSVDGHVLTVIEADGTEIQPVNVTNLDVAVAQRYSVLIDTNQPAGEYYMRGTLTDDMLAYDNPALNKDQRAILRYSNAPSSGAAPSNAAPTIPGNFTGFDATSLKPLNAQDPPNAYKQETLDVNFGISQQSDYRAFFNGTSWQALMSGNSTLLQAYNAAEVNTAYSPPLSQLVVTADQIGAYDLIINNEDEGDHPFHLHGYAPYIIGTGSGKYNPSKLDLSQKFSNPMRRDVFMIPHYGWLVLRIVTDNPGLWLFHCHLVAHMEAGLAAQMQILPSRIKQFASQDVNQGCANVAAFSQKGSS